MPDSRIGTVAAYIEEPDTNGACQTEKRGIVMQLWRSVLGAVLIGALCVVLVPRASAQEALESPGNNVYSDRTIFTFSQPVEVPGMVLPAGTYVFKRLNAASGLTLGSGDYTAIYDESDMRCLGIFVTRTEERPGLYADWQKVRDPWVSFKEHPADSESAAIIDAWFVPNRVDGQQFDYSKELAPIPEMASSGQVSNTRAGAGMGN
jgi:hypothetical protein